MVIEQISEVARLRGLMADRASRAARALEALEAGAHEGWRLAIEVLGTVVHDAETGVVLVRSAAS